MALLHVDLGQFLVELLTSGADDGIVRPLEHLPSLLSISESLFRMFALGTPHN